MNQLSVPRSALATAPAPHLSDRYSFISTAEVIERMGAEGYQVASAKTNNPRKREAAYTRHSLDFRHPDFTEINGAIPRIIFVNSHDGTSAAKLLAGVFRFVCSNGLVVGNTVANISVRHSSERMADELIERVRGLARNTSDLFGKIDRWTRRDLTAEQQREFARFAAYLRWGDAARYEPEEVLTARRAEDEGGDLWRVFNRIQENTVRGGLEGLYRSGRAARSQPLSDIGRDLDFNAQLWLLAEEVAEQW